MSHCFSFTIEGTVLDTERLYNAALVQAVKDGMTPTDAAKMLTEADDDNTVNITACVRMLLDPGLSPDGIEIDDSSCESSEAA